VPVTAEDCFFGLATNPVRSPTFMMGTNVFIIDQLEPVSTILLLAGHHMYSWPESVLTIEFSMHNLRVKRRNSNP